MTASTRAGSTSEESLWARLTLFHKIKLVFMAAAFFSFVLSVSLWFLVDREMGVFVGLWVPTLLALGAILLVGEDQS
jgi:hypothetical protein